MRNFAERMSTEPVRLTGWWALVVGIVVQVGLLWALDTPTKAIVAAALTAFAAQVSGIEWARRNAYSPARVDEIRTEAEAGP